MIVHWVDKINLIVTENIPNKNKTAKCYFLARIIRLLINPMRPQKLKVNTSNFIKNAVVYTH